MDDHGFRPYVPPGLLEGSRIASAEQEFRFVVREEQQIGAGGEGSQYLPRVPPFEQQPPHVDVERDGHAALVGRGEEAFDQVVAALGEGRRDAGEVQDLAGEQVLQVKLVEPHPARRRARPVVVDAKLA